ncbi:ABC transporter [Mariprofundus erugo]|uniref:AarF/UbiB family protein n=1 Tax=Mariprofundus erugo TaxID=2528639 RepID=UPI0010FD9159|nr:AarF/UbiB family protein [Mariprofundus erugo]TLS76504.1 ABC transporter [Mariprofundus erugo]
MNIIKRTIYLLHSAFLLRKIRRSKKDETRQAAQQRLTELLADRRGIGMKIGQAMAGMNDQGALTQLTRSARAWPLKDIIPVLEEQWQQPLESVLDDIDESFSAASLGQVHKGRLSTDAGQQTPGRTVAIKVQYPDIRQAIASELSIAGMLPKAGPVKRWDFDLDGYHATLSETLLDELNYLHEMQQQNYFYHAIDVPGLRVPRIYPELSTGQILVQEWIDGKRLAEAATWPVQVRRKLAETIMQTLWQSLFELGLVHGDPHPGNLLFCYDEISPQMVLLDYGCMVSIPKHRRMALLNLIQGVRGKTGLNSFDAFVGLGFDAQKLQPIRGQLDELARILFQPFVYHAPFDTRTWQLSDHVGALFGDQRWLFRSAAPPDLFLVVRIFQGLVSQIECLDTTLCWSDMLEQALSRESLDYSLRWQLDESAIASAPLPAGSATTLRVQIARPNNTPMDISLTAASALELHSLLPADMLPRIRALNIDLHAISRQLQENGLEPQTLLDFTLEERHYRVWLE